MLASLTIFDTSTDVFRNRLRSLYKDKLILEVMVETKLKTEQTEENGKDRNCLNVFEDGLEFLLHHTSNRLRTHYKIEVNLFEINYGKIFIEY